MLLYRIGRVIAAVLLHVSVGEALLIALAYGGLSFCGLYWAGEADIVSSGIEFIYWLVVTASTVGYGDMSPQTDGGKLFVTLFVIPFGLMLFAMVITRFGYFLSYLISRRHKGLSMINEKQHCVIIGWNAGRTKRLVELLTSDTNGLKESVVLCSDVESENPLPELVEFVKVESYLNEEDMKRCGIAHANRILIDLSADDVTLTTALLCRKLNPDAHKTAYFKDENIGSLLKTHCPHVEVIPSLSIELLARATLDPGSSAVHQQLLDSTEGVNQFSSQYQGKDASFEWLFSQFKRELNATLIGFRNQTSEDITLNPSLKTIVENGATLYYYADKRVESHPGFSAFCT